MRYTLYAGKYLGIPIRIHFTFPLILAVFGAEAWVRGGWEDGIRAVLLILAVFVCVVLHEFGHSLQVRRYGIRVRDVVLLPIGGMARADRIPENPRQEMAVAIAGPLVNFGLAALLYAALWLRDRPIVLEDDFLTNLFAINLILGTFNLIPAYPMDGGRILRGLLALKFPYLRATRYAKNIGQLIAMLFVIVGFVDNTFIMLPVIAVFIYFGAMSEEQSIRVRIALSEKRARDFVSRRAPFLLLTDKVTQAAAVFADGTLHSLLVTDELRSTFGVVNAQDVQRILHDGEGNEPLSAVAKFDFPVLSADMPASQVYYFLKAEKQSIAGVIDGAEFLGLLHFDSLLEGVR